MKLALLGIILAVRCFGAVTLDNYQVGSNNGGTGTVTWTHITACSSSCMGYVMLSSLTNPAITLTWGGVAMTLVTSHARSYGVNGPGTLYLYCVVGPSNGATTIAGTALGWMLGNSVTFSGAKQSCTPDATNFTEVATTGCTTVVAVGFACPITITPVASGVWLLAMFSGNSGTMSLNISPGPPATGTYRGSTNMFSDFFMWDSNGTVSGAQTFYAGTSVNMISYSALIMSIAPFSSPPTKIKPFMLVIP